jgi:hypothetical protein
MIEDLITRELLILYPDIKNNLARRYAHKYTKAVLNEILIAQARPSNDNDELSFSLHNVTIACGKVAGQKRMFPLMQLSARTRLIDVKFTGNIGKLSRVVLNPIYKEMIMDELDDMPIPRLTAAQYAEKLNSATHLIPVDSQTLMSFIHRCRENKATASGKLLEQINDNIKKAEALFNEIHFVDGEGFIPEAFERKETGRLYGKYNSLQRQHREVRHAALGFCHKYDFQAHAFAVMASIARSFEPDLPISAVLDYIKNREVIRARIARELNVSVDVIKQVFTSLTFFSKLERNPYKAIRRAVFTDANFDKLVACRDFQYIYQDFENINRVIALHFPLEDFVSPLDNRQFICRKENGRKKSRAQLHAWIYQNAEAYITDKFIAYVAETTGQEPLLTVHDCVYYRQPLPKSTLIDAQVLLRDEFEFVRLEHEAIYPIGTEQHYQSVIEQDAQFEQQHREFIAEQERLAQGYVSPHVDTVTRVKRDSKSLIDQYKNLPDYEYQLEDFR